MLRNLRSEDSREAQTIEKSEDSSERKSIVIAVVVSTILYIRFGKQ